MRSPLRSRWCKLAVFLACLVPLAMLIANGVRGELGANPIEYITRATGDWTMRFLLITLSITPLRKIFAQPDLIRFRRMLGLFAFFLLTAFSSTAQNRYVVYFKDKAGSPYSVNAPLQYLSQRAIDRRTRQGISITSADFPVNTAYLEGIRSSGARTLYASRWMNCATTECSSLLWCN